MGIVAICHYSFANCGNRKSVLKKVYYIFVNVFYFICVNAITLSFNKHFAYKIETLSRPLLRALVN